MTIKLLETEEKHMKEIFELLQVISNFYPNNKEFKNVLNKFINQEKVFCFDAKKIIEIKEGYLIIKKIKKQINLMK